MDYVYQAARVVSEWTVIPSDWLIHQPQAISYTGNDGSVVVFQLHPNYGMQLICIHYIFFL